MTFTACTTHPHTHWRVSVTYRVALRAKAIAAATRLLIAVLVVAGAVLGAPASPAAAQLFTTGLTPPPGPVLASGTLYSPAAAPSPPVATSSWEEYPNNMFLFWHASDSLVDQAFGTPCGGTAICLAYITYNNFAPDDPYNTSFWTKFERGCTVLAADPAVAGTVGGLDRLMDDAVGPDPPSWVLSAGYTGVVPFFLSSAGGLSAATAAAAPNVSVNTWGPPASYDQCFAGLAPTTPTTMNTLGCSISGTWRTSQSNNYHITFSLTQSGTSVTGTASFSADEGARAGYGGPVSGTVSGTLRGNQLDIVATLPPKPDGFRSRGHYTATVTNSNGVLTASGTLRDDAVANGPTYTWTGTGPTGCGAPGPIATTGTGTGGQSCTWTGTWRAQNEPDLVLTQNGTQVTGTFGSHGNLRGAVAGDVVTANITNSSGDTTSLELHMSAKIDPVSYGYSPAGPACAVMAGVYSGVFPRNFERH